MMKKYLLIILMLIASVNVYAQESQQKFQGFNLAGYSENGEKTWDVNGDTADIQGSQVTISNVVANSYGQQPMNMTAKTGTIDQTSGKMQLNKDVVITNDQGSQLTTDSLNWNRTDDKVSTEDRVVITDNEKGFTVTGKGLEAKPGLKSAQIQKDVTVQVSSDPKKANGEMVTILSDGPMTIDELNSTASFEKNVVAFQPGRKLKADRIDIYFDKEKKVIKQLVCTGNVEIEQGENKTYAQKAIYNADERKLVLSGRPKMIMLTQGNDFFATPRN